MKRMLIELDPELAAELERVAPARSRRRSEFIRMALRRALWELAERATAEAYAAQPDSVAELSFHPSLWEPAAPARTRSKK
ncbi:MAG: hypothetical protein JSW43_04755 [Gemmatimonadota bacterium]|nr:MAG: hypothetical protein JSW43_04755 [Gemmatimonadota bacterium]